MEGDGSGNTGGNGSGDTGNDGDNEDTDGLWNWLSSIADSISSIWETLLNLPGLIVDAFTGLFEWLLEELNKLFEFIGGAIMAIPEAIWDMLVDLFIPDTEYIETKFND